MCLLTYALIFCVCVVVFMSIDWYERKEKNTYERTIVLETRSLKNLGSTHKFVLMTR